MTTFIPDNIPLTAAAPRNEKLLWSAGSLLAVVVHLLVLLYLLWSPSPQQAMIQSPAAAPIVITLAVMPTTSQLSSLESVAQQASQLEEPVPPPSPEKIDVAVKEIKHAEVQVQVRDKKPQPSEKSKTDTPPRTEKPHPVKPLPKKVEVKKKAPATTPESMPSNSSEQLSRQNQAPQVGAASNQVAIAKQSWQSLILAQLQREKRYPGYALRMKLQDTVMVRFTIDRNGNVLEAAIEKSKGYATLDRESLQLLERASPLPKPPASAFTQSDRMELVVPVSFAIRNA